MYTFNEKENEYDSISGKTIPVWKMPKYEQSKKKAVEIIESGKYGVDEADFWILMNATKNRDKMCYSGLIISHNGCLKINEHLDNPVNPHCFKRELENGTLLFTYEDDDVYEVGEFSSANGKNSYPYAMALKRCFDRVVLKKSKLAFYGVYSDSEAEEFKEPVKEDTSPKDTITAEEEKNTKVWLQERGVDFKEILKEYGVKKLSDLKRSQLKHILEEYR